MNDLKEVLRCVWAVAMFDFWAALFALVIMLPVVLVVILLALLFNWVFGP